MGTIPSQDKKCLAVSQGSGAMSNWSLFKVLVRESLTREAFERVPEPSAVMDDCQQVLEYSLAGRENCVMSPVTLFNTAQVCQQIRPGDRVLDLACGPLNQLAQIARLNPDCDFVGLDLSMEMLNRGKMLLAAQGLGNVALVQGAITDLGQFRDGAFDAVISTMALHHLPDESSLLSTFHEAARVVKNNGGVFFSDFCRMKRLDSVRYFVSKNQGLQSPLFTMDYLNSLRAAFSLDDFHRGCQQGFGSRARVRSTWGVPFMMVVKTPVRRVLPDYLQRGLCDIRDALPECHQRELKDIARFFRLGGVDIPVIA